MNEKKICWITASYMLQVDLPLLAELKKEFDIEWYFWGSQDTSSGKLANKYAAENNIKLCYITPKYWILNPLGYLEQNRIIKNLAKKDYALFYFDIPTFPWLLFIIKQHLPINRVILAMHHGKPHSGMRFKLLYFPFLKYLNKQPFFLQYFSHNQSEAFAGLDERKKYIIPLAINNFGESNNKPNLNKVTFTSFGHIIPTKNIKLLIEAGNRLWSKHPNKFVIKIVGHCRNWDKNYSKLIKNKEAFDLDIRRIDESEISNLFGLTHYLVLPYKAVTQSGPLRIAYGYNVPVITSNLDGFKESVVSGITGYMFESDNIDSLYKMMEDVIEKHPFLYNEIKINQKKYVEKNLSVESICQQYTKMFYNTIKLNEN